MTAQEKTAGVLPTPSAASKSLYTRILPAAEQKNNQRFVCFAALRGRFAELGRQLTRSHRADDGAVTYIVSRLDQSRCYTHLHAVSAHLAAIEVNS